MPRPYSNKRPLFGPLAALAVVAFLDNRKVLEVALHAGDEVFVTLAANHSQLALATGPPSGSASLDSQPGREPGPFRAGEDEDGADE